jgi:hypothetical protein
LTSANLKSAHLEGAKLQRANLFRAKDPDLSQAFYDHTTLLPDGYRAMENDRQSPTGQQSLD